jgi:hypothetical protein
VPGSRLAELTVVLGAAVAWKRHPRAGLSDVVEVDLGDDQLVAVGLRPRQELAPEGGDHDGVANVGHAVLDASLANADVEEAVLVRAEPERRLPDVALPDLPDDGMFVGVNTSSAPRRARMR